MRVLAGRFCMKLLRHEDVPFISNNLPKAIEHAIVAILAYPFACLDLSLGPSRGALTNRIHCRLTLGF
jgi:hypothetical protein